MGNDSADLLEEVVSSGRKQLQHHRPVHAAATHSLEKLVFVPIASLADVSDDEYRTPQIALYAVDVIGQQRRTAVSQLIAVAHALESGARSTARVAVKGAASAGEDSSDRIVQPVVEGQHTRKRPVSDHGLDRIGIVQRNTVQVWQHPRQWIVMRRSIPVFPAHVRDIVESPFVLDSPHKLERGFFGRITAHDKINLWIPDQLLIEESGREAAEDDRNGWM